MTRGASAGDIRSRLERAVDGRALVPQGELGRYNVDGVEPKVACLPATEEQMIAVLATACRQQWAVVPWGGGSLMSLGAPPLGADLVVGLARFGESIEHMPGDLTVTVGAGMRLAGLKEALAGKGQWLPVNPPLSATGTVGGMLATNLPGPLGLGYGTVRDFLLGMRVIAADGEVTKSGGRVVKNVTGFDVGKLHIGALGTLGIILEASFKVMPLPKRDATVRGSFGTLGDAMGAANGLLQYAATPDALEIALRGVNRRAEAGDRPNGGCTLLARFLGTGSAVERRVNECRETLSAYGAGESRVVEGSAAEESWESMADFGWDAQDGPCLLVRVGALPSRTRGVAERVEQVLRERDYDASMVVGPGRGVVRCLMPGVKWLDRAVAGGAVEALRAVADAAGGYAVVERCPSGVKRSIDVWGDSAQGTALMRRVKEQMDPGGILSPGRFVGGM